MNVDRSAPTGAVFLSYAREDAGAARRIAEALRAAGLEVWFDEHELRGGDSWDAKIRRQIDACALFIPLISAHTQERSKGYFRLEWKLAVDQTHLLAAGVPFVAPVAIDETKESAALVPPEFLRVQWTRLPGALPTPEFVAQVQRLLGGSAVKTTGSMSVRPNPAAEAKPQSPRALVLMLAFASIVVGIGALFLVLRRVPPTTAVTVAKAAPPTVAAPAVDKSVAVLAFADLSQKRDSEYFSDGISEELLNVLAKIPDLRVAARTSAFFFKDKNLPIPEIAQKLNVAYVVEGSVQRSGDRVKITAQLIKAADGFHVWSDTFTRDLKDVFAVQEEIAALIAQNLSSRLGVAMAAPAAAAPTRNLAAYDTYLRGRAAQTRGSSEILMIDAVRLYEEAVGLDPNYALAWARLAQVRAGMIGGGFDRSAANQARAREAAAAALRLGPDLPETWLAHAIVSQFLDRDHAAAGRALDRAEQLRPGDAELPLGRARVAEAQGVQGTALLAMINQAVAADPQNAAALGTLAEMAGGAGMFAETQRLLTLAAALSPTNEGFVRSQAINLARWTGDARRAIALLELTPEEARIRMRFFNTRAPWREHLGDLAGALRDHEQAATVMRKYPDRSGPRSAVVYALFSQARLARLLGQSARAAALLAEAEAEETRFAQDFPGDDTSAYTRFRILASRGRPEAAMAEFEAWYRRREATHDASIIRSAKVSRASLLVSLNRNEEAVVALRQLMDQGDYHPGYSLRLSIDFAPLRVDPRFGKLCAEAEAWAHAQGRPDFTP